MRVAGGILVGLGLVLLATTFANHMLGMMDVFRTVHEQAGYVRPGEMAGAMHRIMGRSLLLGGAGLVSLLAGLPLLIVGIVRAAVRRREAGES